MIKWDDLTIRVTLPDGTKRQSHARVTNFSSRKNWLIEAEEGCPTLTTKNQIAGDAKKLKLPCLFFSSMLQIYITILLDCSFI